jgi:AcrR family transcriptional regulator
VSGQREATREAILRCAAARLAREGIEGTTLLDVAHDAGLSKGAVTHHFASKDDLVDAVVLRSAEALAARLAALPAEGPFGELLRARCDALWSAWDDDLDDARVMTLVSAAAHHDARLRSVSDGAWTALGAMLSDALATAAASAGLRPRVPAEHLARWVLGLCVGHRLTRGEAGADAPREALRMSLYALFEL